MDKGATILIASLLWTLFLGNLASAQSSPPAGLAYSHQDQAKHPGNTDSLVRDLNGDGKVLNLRTLRHLESNYKKVQRSQVWIPTEAHRARSKDQFLQIVGEYHLRETIYSRIMEGTSLGESIKRVEEFFKKGFSYEWSSSEVSKSSSEDSKSSTKESADKSQDQTNSTASADPTKNKKSFRAYLNPQDARAHFFFAASRFTADLIHDVDSNETSLEFVIPEMWKGQISFVVSPKSSTQGSIMFRRSW